MTIELSRMVSTDAPCGNTWEEWEEIAKFTGEVDYGCRFDDAGICDGDRAYDCRNKNCCDGCAGWGGYLEKVPAEAVETVEREFDENDGFWRPGGCALPRKWRSFTCLEHHCLSYKDRLSAGWRAFSDLFESQSDKTVAEVREIMRGKGLLRELQLVTLS